MKKRVLITGVCILTFVCLVGCSKSDTKKASSESTTVTEAAKLEEKFAKISVGRQDKKGEGGDSLEKVQEQLGKPAKQEKGEENGDTTTMAIWSGIKGAQSVDITFLNDKVISKAITGMDIPKQKKITKKKFDTIKTDGSCDRAEAEKELGIPDGIEVHEDAEGKFESLVWSKYVEGKKDASVLLSLKDGKAIMKNQTGLK